MKVAGQVDLPRAEPGRDEAGPLLTVSGLTAPINHIPAEVP